MSAFLLTQFLQSGEAISFFERGYELKANGVGCKAQGNKPENFFPELRVYLMPCALSLETNL